MDSERLKALKIAAWEYVFPLLQLEKLDVPFISQAKTQLIEKGQLPENVRVQIESLADDFDKQYYPLYEADPQNKAAYLQFFNQACVLHAMSYAGETDPYESTVESIYEAAQAVEDKEAFIEYLETLAQT